MKAFVTTIGERTTQLCINQLCKFGFEIFVLDLEEPWIDKYKRFIAMASEDCIKIDADIIVNKNVGLMGCDIKDGEYAIAHSYYDLYQNDLSTGGPIFYTKKAIDIIKQNFDKLSMARPETSAMRLPEMRGHVGRRNVCIGTHGIGQDNETIKKGYT